MVVQDPGHIRKFEAGALVFSEGEVPDNVYILEAGEVEILRGTGAHELRLAVLRRGAIFGEMGVLRGKPRSTTVRCLSEVEAITLSKKEFLAAFGGDSGLALPLLKMLCERLARADDVIYQHQYGTSSVRHDAVKGIHLFPASSDVANQIGSDGIVVEDLPFRIGSHLESGKAATTGPRHLTLRAPGNLQLAQHHMVIEARHDHLRVRDLDSHLGTMVNGIRIASFEHNKTAPLRPGPNDLLLGGIDSPYRFKLVVEV